MKHPHYENMRLYLEDAAETERPWERWEYKISVPIGWVPCSTHPGWHPETQYRRIDPHREYKEALAEGRTIEVIQFPEIQPAKWYECEMPKWDLPPECYRVKPEPTKVKMWQWIYCLRNGETRISKKYFPDKETAQKHYDESTTKLLHKAGWTEIEVEQ